MSENQEKLIAVLEEFMKDIEAVASTFELETPCAFEWPDLIVTYQKAKKLLEARNV